MGPDEGFVEKLRSLQFSASGRRSPGTFVTADDRKVVEIVNEDTGGTLGCHVQYKSGRQDAHVTPDVTRTSGEVAPNGAPNYV
jgi:hypothetical protein